MDKKNKGMMMSEKKMKSMMKQMMGKTMMEMGKGMSGNHKKKGAKK